MKDSEKKKVTIVIYNVRAVPCDYPLGGAPPPGCRAPALVRQDAEQILFSLLQRLAEAVKDDNSGF